MSLSASHSQYWTLCPRFKKRKFYNKSKSKAADEGIAAAWLAKMILKNDAHDTYDLLGRTAPNGHDIDEDMCLYVQKFIDYVTSGTNEIHSELTLELPAYNLRGRLDAYVTDNDNMIEISDLKYGFKIIYPEWNTQLIYYGLFLIKPYHEIIKLTICQPRINDGQIIKTWILTQEQWKIVKKWAMKKLIEANDMNTPGNAVSHACDKCSNSHACKALKTEISEMSELLDDPASDLTGEEIGKLLTASKELVKLVQAQLNGLQSEAEYRCSKGEYIPGYQMGNTYSNRTFDVDIDAIELLTGVSPYKKTVMTPAELEKNGAHKTIVNSISSIKVTGKKLVTYDENKIKRIFEKG